MLLRAVAYTAVLSVVAPVSIIAQDVRVTPGPLERRARTVTPENPVPRRTESKAVAYPAEMRQVGGRGLVTLQVTLDGKGKVAEIRSLRAQLLSSSRPIDSTIEKQVADALAQSAIDAVREWTFASPANAPLAFPVTFTYFDGEVDVALAPPPTPGRGRGAAPFPATPARLSPPWPAAEGAYRVGALTTPPRRIKDVKPEFPDVAQRKRVGGAVVIQILIGPDGKVRDARILESAPDFDEAALNAVRQWEYTPSMLNGVAVPVVMTTTITFALK